MDSWVKQSFVSVVVAICIFVACIAVFVKTRPLHAQSDAPLFLEIDYSPATNLEEIDLRELDKATKTIDISTYSLTDQALANKLLYKANHGVHVRIYRDLRQYEGEVARPNNAMALFIGNKNVEVRIKHSSILAHLKAYCIDAGEPDEEVRDGSANWSEDGEKKQDNSLILTNDQATVKGFESNFNKIWSRADNRIVQ